MIIGFSTCVPGTGMVQTACIQTQLCGFGLPLPNLPELLREMGLLTPLGIITLNLKRQWGLLEPGKGLSVNLCRDIYPKRCLAGAVRWVCPI